MKIRHLLYFALLLPYSVLSQKGIAQEPKDSLNRIWLDQSKSDSVRLNALYDLAWDIHLQASPDTALLYADTLFQYATEKELAIFQIAGINTKATALKKKGMYHEANEAYKQMLKLAKREKDSSRIAATYGNSASVYRRLGKYKEGIEKRKKQLEILHALNDSNNIGIAKLHLGYYHVILGQYKEAIECYNTSYTLLENYPNQNYPGTALVRLGIAYDLLGDYATSMYYHKKSLALFEKMEYTKGIGIAFNNMAILFAGFGDFEKAEEYYLKALKISESVNDLKSTGSLLNNLGVNAKYQGRYSEALNYYKKSLAIEIERDDKLRQVDLYNNIANAHKEMGAFDKAEDLFLKSMEIGKAHHSPRTKANTQFAMAEMYLKKHDYDNVIEQSSKSFATCSEIGLLDLTRLNSQLLYEAYIRKGEHQKASKYLFLSRANVYTQLNLNFFTLSEREKEHYFRLLEIDFGNYYDFSLHHHKENPFLADTAYNIALQNKGLILKSSSAMRSAINNSGDTLLIKKYNRWLELKKEISDNYAEGNDVVDLENEARDLEKKLIQKSKVVDDFDKVRNLNWKDVQRSLAKNECVIEFVNFKSIIDTSVNERYMAIIVTPKSKHPRIVELCSKKELEEVLGVFQGNNISFVKDVYGTKKEAQTDLYKLIWKPIEGEVKGFKKIYYSPTGLLHKVSFSAIAKSKDVYLSDLYNLRRTSSTGRIVTQDDVAVTNMDDFFLMGGINFNGQNADNKVWSYLPGSLKESEGVENFLSNKKYPVTHLHDKTATEKAFKENVSGSEFVHIATHGFFFPDPELVKKEMAEDHEKTDNLEFRGTTDYANWSFVQNKNPLMRSGIVLAGANDVWNRDPSSDGEDGVLTAQEVSTIDLNDTKLVVLSACETGLGDIKGTEGVYGLQRSFKMAGVNYLIMSLWQVPDTETSEFMMKFYQFLDVLKSIPEAFKKTQAYMRKKNDPYYWGAFILVE